MTQLGYAKILNDSKTKLRLKVTDHLAPEIVFDLNVKKNRKFRRARLRYRFVGDDKFRKVDFKRKSTHEYWCSVDTSDRQNVIIEYFLVVQNKKGKPFAVFGDPSKSQIIATKTLSAHKKDLKEQSKIESNNDLDIEKSSISSTEIIENASIEQQFANDDSVLRFVEKLSGGGIDDNLEAEMQALSAFDEELVHISSRHLPQQFLGQVYELTRIDIDKIPARTLADLLRLLPGVSWSLDISGFQNLNIRGAEGNHRISFMIDGVIVKNPLDGRFLQFYHPDMIENIRVYPQAALQNSSVDSQGTLIVIETRQMKSFWLNTALRSTFGLELSTGIGGEYDANWKWGIAGFVNGEIGQRKEIVTDRYSGTPQATSIDLMHTNGQRIDGGFQVQLNGEFQDWQLSTSYFGQYQGRGLYIGIYDAVSPDSSMINAHNSFNLSLKKSINEGWDIEFYSSLAYFFKQQYMQLSPLFFSTEDRNGDGVREVFEEGQLLRRTTHSIDGELGMRHALHLFPFNRLEIATSMRIQTLPFGEGVESNIESDGSVKELSGVNSLDLDFNNGCVFFGTETDLPACRLKFVFDIQDSQLLFDRLLVKAGTRVQIFSDMEFNLAQVLQPYLFVEFEMFNNSWLFANASQGSRSPTFLEKFELSPFVYDRLARGDFLGNKNLTAEITRQFETGSHSAFEVFDVDYHFGASVYAKQIAQSIQYIPLNGNEEMVHNAGDEYWLGTELIGQARFKNGSGLMFNWSWNRGLFDNNKNLENFSECSISKSILNDNQNQEIPACSWLTDSPQFLANAMVYWNVAPLGTFSTTAHFMSERRNNARSTLEGIRFYQIPAVAVLNVAFQSIYFYDVIAINFDVYNLLDAEIKDSLPRPDRMPGLIPRQGLSAFMGIKLKLPN